MKSDDARMVVVATVGTTIAPVPEMPLGRLRVATLPSLTVPFR
jgi:hypothetical protein